MAQGSSQAHKKDFRVLQTLAGRRRTSMPGLLIVSMF